MVKIKKIVILFLSCLLLIFVGVACADENGGYVLNESEVTVKANGETVEVYVSKDDEKYNGAIAWYTEDKNIATIYQGQVKGLTAGSTTGYAVVNDGNEEYKLSVSITVLPSILVEQENIMAYSGSGNIEITIAEGQLPLGATYEVASIKDTNGNEFVSKVKRIGKLAYLTNTSTDAITEGEYTITYAVSTSEITENITRTIRVVKINRYEDLFMLDPIDGSETMYGLAACQQYMVNLERHDENPGQYVTYNDEGNTGYTQENGMNQNKAAFHESLKDSGYKGILKEGIKGYDTVYRMYCRKNNTTVQPLPFFYLNLKNTANPAWTNLNKLPADTSINIWLRTLVRYEGETEYKPKQGGWLYFYKNQASGITHLGGLSASYDAKGGWSHYSISLNSFKEELAGASNIAFGVQVNDTQRVEVLYELYSVEFSVSKDVGTVLNKGIDIGLVGSYANVYDAYTWTIYDTNNREIKEGNNKNAVIDTIENGKYTIQYTLSQGGKAYKEPFVKSLTVGLVNDLTDRSKLGVWAWTKSTLEMHDGAPVGKPIGSALDKDTYASFVRFDNAKKDDIGWLYVYFNIQPVFENIDKLHPMDKIRIWTRNEAGTTDSTVAYMCVSEGWTHAGENGGNETKTSDHFRIENENYKNEEWYPIDITIEQIRQAMQTRTHSNGKVIKYDTIGLDLRSHGSSGKKAYFYSVEFISDTAYSIDVNDNIKEYIEVAREAYQKETVTVTVKKPIPDWTKIVVTTKDGKEELVLLPVGDTFTMFASDCEISLKNVELNAEDLNFSMFTGDISLPSLYDDFYTDMSVEIKDKDGSSLMAGKDYILDGTTLTMKKADEFCLDYTLFKNGNRVKELTRTLCTGIVNSIDSFATSNLAVNGMCLSAYVNETIQPVKQTTFAKAGIPEPTDARLKDKDIYSVAREGNANRVQIGFNIRSLLEQLDTLDDLDYMRFWMYNEEGTVNSTWNNSFFSLCELKRPNAGEGTNNATKHSSRFHLFEEEYGVGKWIAWRITIAELKMAIASAPDIDYAMIALDIRGGGGSREDEGKLVYFYSLEFCHYTDSDVYGIIEDFTDQSRLGWTFWDAGVADTDSLVTNAPVGVPTGSAKSGNTYMKIDKCIILNGTLTRSLPSVSVGSLFYFLDYYKDNDYISLWLYDDMSVAEQNAGGIRVFNMCFGSAGNNILTDSVAIQVNEQHKIGEWFEAKVTIKQIKDALASKGIDKSKLLYFHLSYSSHTSNSAGSAYYIYSLEFNKA